jgi:hypothetical protein
LTFTRTRRGKSHTAHVALTLAVALGFFVQAFIAQTHIHGAPPAIGDSTATLAWSNSHGDEGTPFDPFPASADPVNQVYGGSYSAPGAVLLVQPALRIAHVIDVPEARISAFILSHAWRSRAPPIA